MSHIKKRVVIHTGPGKTGTSAIQAWLVRNINFLSSNAILYPKYRLLKENISSGNRDELLTLQENGSWMVDSEKVKRLLANFEASQYSTLLLSSEFFFKYIPQINKMIPQAEFIAYIRNPVELLESNYNQGIKRNAQTKKFTPPSRLDNYFWNALNNIFEMVDPSQMYLRSYNKNLMVGGNIVSDLLSVLQLNHDIEDKRVNASYTFGALELKRLLNHFDLGELDPTLDSILQGYDVGTSKYSLLKKETFLTLNHDSCLKMASFIEKYKQSQLIPLLKAFQAFEIKPYLSQQANFEQLKDVVDYIKKVDKTLYLDIKTLLVMSPDLVIDNVLVYEVFNVEPKPLDKESLIDSLLLNHINKFGVIPNKRGKICYELSCYFRGTGDLENGLSFAKAAYFFNPHNINFTMQLNKLLIESKRLQCGFVQKPLIGDRFKKIKQRFFPV